MNEHRDRLLESLFDAADEKLADDAFTLAVEQNIRSHRRRIMLVRLAVVALLVLLELALDSPLQNSLGAVGSMLATALFPVDHEWLAFVMAPVNSIGGLIGLFLVGLHYFYRKIAH